MSRTRVVHIITKLELGGAQRGTLFLASHLDRRRFEVYLVTGRGGILEGESRRLKGVKTFQAPSLIRRINPFLDLLALWELYRFIRKIRVDRMIVHTHSSKAGILGRWAAYFAGVGVIVHTYHGYGFHDHQSRLVKWILIGVERLTRWVTTHVISVSRDNWQRGLAWGLFDSDRVTLIPESVEFDRFRRKRSNRRRTMKDLELDPGRPVVGMIACLKAQKAPLDFVRVAHRVLQRRADAQFILVGDGVLRQQVENEVERLGIGERFRWLGWRRDVEDILSCMTLFVLTSRWEGLPLVFLEARLSGLPIVANRVDGAAEVIHDGVNGFLVSVGDTESMAERICLLLECPDLRRSMSKTAVEVPRRFDSHVAARRQQEIYEALLPPAASKSGHRLHKKTCAA